jgi:hypothetical protein
MRRFSRATTRPQSNVRVVFVDRLAQEMMHLRALRKEVADAETRATPQVRHALDLPLRHWRQLPFRFG